MLEWSQIIGGILVSLASGYTLYKVQAKDKSDKERESKIENLSKEVAQLKATSVSETRVRVMMKEELKPLSDSLDKLNNNISEIKDWVAEERGFKKGLTAAANKTS